MADYKLIRPCAKCPFRNDREGYLREDRAREIAESVAGGAEFICHETTVYDEEADDMVEGPNGKFCAGALIMCEKQGVPNQMMRIAENLGVYDPERLDMDAPVVGSAFEFVRQHSDRDEEDEDRTCAIANYGCEAPAGIMVGGMAVPAEITGEVFECEGCGELVCDSCMDGKDLCPYCEDDRG